MALLRGTARVLNGICHGLGARHIAADRVGTGCNASKTDALPSDKAQLIKFLGSAEKAQMFLVCPADGTTSYEILSPGASESGPGIVYVHCPIHNNVGLVDGSAHMLGGNRKLGQRDGKWVIGE